MKPTVYLETTVISYLSASPSRDIVVAAHQQITRDWWERRDRFELLTSQAVLDEASRGDTDAAARRMSLLAEIPVLTVSDEVIEFAELLLRAGVGAGQSAFRCHPYCRGRHKSHHVPRDVELCSHRKCNSSWQDRRHMSSGWLAGTHHLYT